jgi:hypothetical protein
VASTVPWVPADVEAAGAGDGSLNGRREPEQTIASLPEEGIVIAVAADLFRDDSYPSLPNDNFPPHDPLEQM